MTYGTFYAKNGAVVRYSSFSARAVRPSVYLIPGVQMKGSGTTADPYVFAE